MRAKKRSMLAGPWRLIAPNPDLGPILSGDREHRAAFIRGDIAEHNAPVDHHIVRSSDGAFHLWACVRATAVGRVLHHWESDKVDAGPWVDTGEELRADHGAGECLHDWEREEWLQSPYFVHDGSRYFMFYGGHRAGVDSTGNPVTSEFSGDRAVDPDPSLHQICLMTSDDGREWTRHRNNDGTSRVFLGPGETRDPCVIRIGELWHMYYAGYFDFDRPEEGGGFVVRTSIDLVYWSDWKLVHRDPSFGASRFAAECPFVVERDGYFYLFRTVDYYRSLTYVFRSDDPYDFGIGDARQMLVGRLACAAAELYTFDGVDYLSSSHAPLVGEHLCRLAWVDEP